MKTTKISAATESAVNEQISLSDFSQKVIDFGTKLFEDTTNDYGNFYQHTKSQQDQLADLLIIGILWNNTKAYLSVDAIFYSPLFNFLNKRKSNKRFISTNQKFKNSVLYSEHNKDIVLNERFEYMHAWVKASDTLHETHELIETWQYWAERLPLVKQQEIWQKLEEYSKWFIDAINFYFEDNFTQNISNDDDALIINTIKKYLLVINKVRNEIDYQTVSNEQNINPKLISA